MLISRLGKTTKERWFGEWEEEETKEKKVDLRFGIRILRVPILIVNLGLE